MGHGKLKKFNENDTFSCLLQPSTEEVLSEKCEGDKSLNLKPHPIRGHWAEKMFGNSLSAAETQDKKIVLELGCGKGEYTIALAERHPENNFIGVDIKGARLWTGAKYASVHSLSNVAFLRTRIEFVEAFFAPSEVSEIWLTFSDPQMKSENSRLTSPVFLERYRHFLRKEGIIRLKTDSTFLYEYTKAVCEANGLEILACTSDLYAKERDCPGFPDELFEVQTFYEKNFLEQGFPINYIAFRIEREGDFVYPNFDAAYWRAEEKPRLLPGHQRPASR